MIAFVEYNFNVSMSFEIKWLPKGVAERLLTGDKLYILVSKAH